MDDDNLGCVDASKCRQQKTSSTIQLDDIDGSLTYHCGCGYTNRRLVVVVAREEYSVILLTLVALFKPSWFRFIERRIHRYVLENSITNPRVDMQGGENNDSSHCTTATAIPLIVMKRAGS
jgi:hypothetical protein